MRRCPNVPRTAAMPVAHAQLEQLVRPLLCDGCAIAGTPNDGATVSFEPRDRVPPPPEIDARSRGGFRPTQRQSEKPPATEEQPGAVRVEPWAFMEGRRGAAVRFRHPWLRQSRATGSWAVWTTASWTDELRRVTALGEPVPANLTPRAHGRSDHADRVLPVGEGFASKPGRCIALRHDHAEVWASDRFNVPGARRGNRPGSFVRFTAVRDPSSDSSTPNAAARRFKVVLSRSQ